MPIDGAVGGSPPLLGVSPKGEGHEHRGRDDETGRRAGGGRDADPGDGLPRGGGAALPQGAVQPGRSVPPGPRISPAAGGWRPRRAPGTPPAAPEPPPLFLD